MVTYKNGNYTVLFDEKNGSKVRFNKLDNLTPEFPECLDLRISSICTVGCSVCYEGNTPNGKFADIMNQGWVDSLHPYTEVAIGGNEPLHPDLIPFLEKLKAKKVFASMTVNQFTFEKYFGLISKLCNEKLIYGLGVSLVDPNPDFLAKFKMFPNGVLHVINGVLTKKQIDALRGKDLKMLILGYKNLGRGIDYLKHEESVILSNQAVLKNEIWNGLADEFAVLSFDNLAISQLDIKGMFERDGKDWDKFFMGKDSEYTFYIDAVNHKFAGSSLAQDKFDMTDNVTEMFNVIRGKYALADQFKTIADQKF